MRYSMACLSSSAGEALQAPACKRLQAARGAWRCGTPRDASDAPLRWKTHEKKQATKKDGAYFPGSLALRGTKSKYQLGEPLRCSWGRPTLSLRSFARQPRTGFLLPLPADISPRRLQLFLERLGSVSARFRKILTKIPNELTYSPANFLGALPSSVHSPPEQNSSTRVFFRSVREQSLSCHHKVPS